MPRVLAYLLGGTQKKDIRALAKYFTKPGGEGKRHMAGGKSEGGKHTEKRSDPPPAPPKPFRLETGKDWLEICQHGNAGPKKEDLPMECCVEVAYEGLDLDPFAAYDPYDFDLSDVKAHNIKTKGITVKVRSGNRIVFEVTDPECSLYVDGFDSNIRLRARLTYEEKKNGPAIDAE